MRKIQVVEYDTTEQNRFQQNISIPIIKEPVPRFIIDVLGEHLRNKINLQPEFQRQFVWNRKKQKELVKSLCVGIPLPMFYFAEGDKNIREVVYGQQRLTTIFGLLKPKSINNYVRSKIISNVRISRNGKRLSLAEIKNEIQ